MRNLVGPPSKVQLIELGEKDTNGKPTIRNNPTWTTWLFNLYQQVLENVNSDHLLEIAKGNVVGSSLKHVFGHNEAVGSTAETLWPEGGIYVPPTAAAAMMLSSSSANDTSAGTGARTVVVNYIDNNYVEQTSDTMTMNGQTGVTILKDSANASILSIEKIKPATAGSLGWNDGTIYTGTGTVTTGKPAVVYGLVEPQHNESLMAFYLVPANKSAYVGKLLFSCDTNQALEAMWMQHDFGGLMRMREHVHFRDNIASVNFETWEKVPQKSLIELRATAATSCEMSGFIDMVVVSD